VAGRARIDDDADHYGTLPVCARRTGELCGCLRGNGTRRAAHHILHVLARIPHDHPENITHYAPSLLVRRSLARAIGLVTDSKTHDLTGFFRPARARALKLRNGRSSTLAWMPRFPIGLVVCLAMLALLAGLGGTAAAPSYPEVATPSPLARFVLGPLPSRRSVCTAHSRCNQPRPSWLPLP
jgi:hypothetical protein